MLQIKPANSLILFLLNVLVLSGCKDDHKTADDHSNYFPSYNGFHQSGAVDTEIKRLMQKVGAEAVTFAVIDHGKVLYEKAYGFKNSAKTIPLRSDALMRTGSNVKPITAAAIQQLARAGLLNLSDHAYCTGDNKPCWLSASLLSSTTDARVKDITIAHLVEHKGGFTRDSDPFGSEYLCADLNLNCPVTRVDIARYMLSQPLDFMPGDPGNLDGYSNFGYMVLGMIVEQASGTSFIDYVQKNIMNPIGISDADFKAAHTLLKDRDPREPNYISTAQSPSVYHMGTTAAFADEGFISENWISVGMGLTTAKSLAMFAQHYSIPYGEKLSAYPVQDGAHWGNTDGISSIVHQLDNGRSYAIFLNISIEISDFIELQNNLDQIIKQ